MADLHRVSCTTLESFRRLMDPDDAWTTEADVIASVLRTTQPTRKMILGSALGEIIETPEKFYKPDLRAFENRGVAFEELNLASVVFPLYDRRGPFEVKGTKVYGDMNVVAKVDQILGLQVIENKATTSAFDFWKYADSAQWRLECDIFGCTQFTYRIFLIKDDGEIVEVKDCVEFNLYPYPDLHADCAALVGEFRAWADHKKLLPALAQQQREASAR